MGQQFLLDFKTKPAYNAVDFFVSSSNETAYKWIHQWPRWPNHVLSLYGAKGSGKTHLAHVWQELAHADFHTLDTLQHANLDDVFQKNPCMIIDDVDWAQHEKLLFHIYNTTHSQKGYTLLVSEDSPEIWDIQLADLKSRLNAIPKCKIEKPDDQLRLALIQKLFTDHQVTISEDIQNKILDIAPRSFDGMQAYVEKICELSFTEKRSISSNLINRIKI